MGNFFLNDWLKRERDILRNSARVELVRMYIGVCNVGRWRKMEGRLAGRLLYSMKTFPALTKKKLRPPSGTIGRRWRCYGMGEMGEMGMATEKEIERENPSLLLQHQTDSKVLPYVPSNINPRSIWNEGIPREDFRFESTIRSRRLLI